MELIGHQNTKKRVQIAIDSANFRNSAMPHMLLSGVAGCGKTTTAKWLSDFGGYDYFPTSPLELKTKKNVYNLLEKLNINGYNEVGDRVGKIKPTILFFDEVHQMPVIAQEILGLAMERFELESDVVNKLIWLPYFTMVGATTDDGLLTKPFRERFKSKFIFEPYKDIEMFDIIKFHATKNKLPITQKAIENITKRSRGIPRIMITYLETIRDVMYSEREELITNNLVDKAFDTMGVDKTGLTKVEIKLLISLFEAGIPIGIDNLSIITNESSKTLGQTIEPFLIRRGFIIRTGKGRMITKKGAQYLEDTGYLETKTQSKKFINASYERK